jgi:hypothetical protein
LKFIKQFIIDKIDEIRLAQINWGRRESASIKASTNGTTYDRYDPAHGLHKPYEVKV